MGAKAAAKQIVKSMNGIKEEQKEKTSEKSCTIDTSQSYYLSKSYCKINNNKRKIKLLRSKLFGSATDCVTTFQLRYPREAKDFSKKKQCLQERYHGGDSRKIYLTEYNNCIRNPGKSIRDYACRIQKLFSFAYPTKEGKWVDLEMREQLIMDKFWGD
ncbi:hypothetical protein GHT06_011491 [Daphnia sinensis]|uniref:Uncharacterized protein n=1 Tax=Daphnia sinensis TaxID=1820382 RepID=A0AAD5PXZ4_9CRUS|nr:hypothetical protein GHT06_011491 [Daphnia sinensis]